MPNRFAARVVVAGVCPVVALFLACGDRPTPAVKAPSTSSGVQVASATDASKPHDSAADASIETVLDDSLDAITDAIDGRKAERPLSASELELLAESASKVTPFTALYKKNDGVVYWTEAVFVESRDTPVTPCDPGKPGNKNKPGSMIDNMCDLNATGGGDSFGLFRSLDGKRDRWLHLQRDYPYVVGATYRLEIRAEPYGTIYTTLQLARPGDAGIDGG